MTLNELWTKAIDEIAFEDVRAFCARQVREHVLVDYKKRPSDKDAQHQIAKLVAAFANTQGGIIVWGVSENREGSDYPDPDPQGEDLDRDLPKKITSACARRIVPSISPEVSGFLESPNRPGFGFMVVRVPQGDLVPYTVDRIIYERVVDSSEPRAADLTTIVNLLARRNLAEKVGHDRRQHALDRIERAVVVERPRTAPDVYKSLPAGLLVSAGPIFTSTPRCSPQELLNKCHDANTAANFDHNLIREFRAVPVSEGLFWHVSPGSTEPALNVDVYGNVVYFNQSLVEPVGAPVKKLVALRELASLLTRCVRFLCKLNEGLGWRSPVTCNLTFIGTRNVCLPRNDSDTVLRAGASCPHDEKIDVHAVIRLPEDANSAIDELLQALQWSWGVHKPRSAAELGLA